MRAIPVHPRCLLIPLAFAILSIVPREARATPPRTVVSLTFDDTFSNQYQMRSLLAFYGMKATFYVNSSFVGTTGHMTLAQIQALQSDGHEIAGHTIDHPDLVTLTRTGKLHEVCDDRVWLLNNRLNVRNFAYPFGSFDAETQQVVKACGYNSARGIGGVVGPTCTACGTAESIPPAYVYDLLNPGSVLNTTPLSTMQKYVTQAENNGGGWVQIVFHNVCDNCSTYAITTSQMQQFLFWLALRGFQNTVVKTVNDIIGGPLQPGIASQNVPPPPAPVPVALTNSSLEAFTLSTSIPDCWEVTGWGVNTPQWSRSTDAHSGTSSEQVQIGSYTSGDTKLMINRAGQCAPAVIPGHRYTVSAFYKGTLSPFFEIYLRDSSGNWALWEAGATLPVSASWTSGSFQTMPLPTGTTAISVGLAASASGTLSMDDFSLVDNGS